MITLYCKPTYRRWRTHRGEPLGGEPIGGEHIGGEHILGSDRIIYRMLSEQNRCTKFFTIKQFTTYSRASYTYKTYAFLVLHVAAQRVEPLVLATARAHEAQVAVNLKVFGQFIRVVGRLAVETRLHTN